MATPTPRLRSVSPNPVTIGSTLTVDVAPVWEESPADVAKAADVATGSVGPVEVVADVALARDAVADSVTTPNRSPTPRLVSVSPNPVTIGQLLSVTVASIFAGEAADVAKAADAASDAVLPGSVGPEDAARAGDVAQGSQAHQGAAAEVAKAGDVAEASSRTATPYLDSLTPNPAEVGQLLTLSVLANPPALTDAAADTARAGDEGTAAQVNRLPGVLQARDRSITTGAPSGDNLQLDPTGQHVEYLVQAAAAGRFDLTALVAAVAAGQLRILLDGVVVATRSFVGDAALTESVADVAIGRDTVLDSLTPAAGGVYQLAADRATRWDLVGLRTVGGWQAFRNRPVYATIAAATYGNGTVNARAGIQAQLDACPPGYVVVLGAGTFLISGDPLRVSTSITLRGSGGASGTGTLLLRTDGTGAPLVAVGPDRWAADKWTTSVNLTSDAVKGSFSVTVASTAGLAVGQIVLIDEQDDPALVLRRDASAYWAGLGPDPDGGGGWFGRMWRAISEVKEIASISGSTVTFTSPFHTTYRVAFQAQLSRNTFSATKYAGVEDLAAEGGREGGIRLEFCAYSWVKTSRVTHWIGEGVSLHGAFRCELRGTYIHDTDDPNPGGGGYAISRAWGGAENLIEDCITLGVNKNIVARGAGAGDVVAYNYFDDCFISYAPTWQEVSINSSHMVGSHHSLHEGNVGPNMDTDVTHGNENYQTFFRNHATGQRRSFTDDQSARCAGVSAYCRFHSFVGNVLGRPGMTAGTSPGGTGAAMPWVEEDVKASGNWLLDPTGAYNAKAIWRLGVNSTGGGTWDHPAEPGVLSTTVRDGNFDHLTGTQKWITRGSPATLPDSLYLTEKPAFFGSLAWPPVNPATGTVTAIPAKARFDAGTPMAVTDDPVTPVPMELISRSVPAAASAGTASHGQDASYGGPLWGFTAAQLGANGWLAYDLSGVPAAKRQRILVALYQGLGNGQQQLNFRAFGDASVYQNVATAYVLEGATSGSGPWTALATVTQNCQHYKTHRLDFGAYSWLRFRATAGSPYLQMDVYGAAQGVTDGFALFGDSITSNVFSADYDGFPPEWFAKAIQAARPAHFPPVVGGGIPFMTAGDAVSVLVNGTGGFTTGLDQAARLTFRDVKFIGLIYGANDGDADSLTAAFRSNYQTIINAFRAQGQVVALAAPTWAVDGTRQSRLVQIRAAIGFHIGSWAAGTFAVGAYVWRGGRVYRCTTAGTSVTGPTGTGTGIADGGTARWAYVPSLREDYANDPGVIGGPDLYSAFQGHPEWFDDGLHPNAAGSAVWRNAWTSWALATIY